MIRFSVSLPTRFKNFNDIHHSSINPILNLLTQVQILLDSGAVIRNDALDNRSKKSFTATSKTAISANGLPLKVMGQVNTDAS